MFCALNQTCISQLYNSKQSITKCIRRDQISGQPQPLHNSYEGGRVLYFLEIIQSLKWLAMCWMTEVWFPAGVGIFSSPPRPGMLQAPTAAPSPESKWQECDANHTSPSHAKVKDLWNFTSTLSALLSWRCTLAQGQVFFTLQLPELEQLRKIAGL